MCKPRSSFTETSKIPPYFSQFLSGSILLRKNSHNYFHMLFAPRWGGTSIKKHKKKIGGGKPRTFCFWKTSFVHSRSGTYYAFLLGYFGVKFLPDIRHCVYWVLAKIWAPYLFHKIRNIFFIHHCQGWKVGSFVCKIVWFFSYVSTRLFDLKFVMFCPKFSRDSYQEYQEKSISREFFKNFVQTKAILYFLQIFYGFVLRWKNLHKYFHMLFAPS